MSKLKEIIIVILIIITILILIFLILYITQKFINPNADLVNIINSTIGE